MVVFCVSVGYVFYPNLDGYLTAQRDLNNNVPKHLVVGEPLPYEQRLSEILKQQYNIEAMRIVDCAVGSSEYRYAQAYNGTIATRFAERYGRDIIAEAYANAEKEWSANSTIQ